MILSSQRRYYDNVLRGILKSLSLALTPPKIYWGGAFGDNRANNVGLSRKHILEGTDMALERLQLKYVDLIYAHRPDRQTPMEEIVRAFNHVINSGKVRTADMGGKSSTHHLPRTPRKSHSLILIGAATTSEFTAAVIKNIQ